MLRGESGAAHIIANGSITVLSNYTREYSYYVFETILAHRADANLALKILEETGKEMPPKTATSRRFWASWRSWGSTN